VEHEPGAVELLLGKAIPEQYGPNLVRVVGSHAGKQRPSLDFGRLNPGAGLI
jgi:hypothetical protein